MSEHKLKDIEAPPHIGFSEQVAYALVGGNKVIFDIGSRDDDYFSRAEPSNIVHCFEPNPNFYSNLKEKHKDISNSVLNNFGLGNDNNIYDYFTSSQSIIKNPWHPGDSISDFKIQIKRLDSYCNDNNIKVIDFIKTDTEGMDYSILKASYNKILELSVPYIQFEWWSEGVSNFRNLMANEYDLFFINSPVYKSFIDSDDMFIKINDDISNIILHSMNPRGYGGNIFCINKLNRCDGIESIKYYL